MNEHYCRKWIAIKNLKELKENETVKPVFMLAEDEEVIDLTENFGYEIKSENFETHGTLNNLRSLYIPEKNLLLLNQLLDENQKTFIFAKEIGFNVLKLTPRPNTYSWLDFTSFDELLNNYYASYFAGCILIPKEELVEKLEDFFDEPEWNSQKLAERSEILI